MAVMQNKIVFGGVDSSTYGIYISGEGVFNAPKRDVEMITIPGRNGQFALDNGRFENITVSYPAYTYETSMATFQQNLANFRNALSAKKGYQRLTDTFHTDEYRMAAFIDGIEIKPIKYNTASEFTITFDCKPQRFLTSGETAVSVASGGTLSNPTLFESSPLLEIEGYGTIEFNGYEIELEDELVGDVAVNGPTFSSYPYNMLFPQVYINLGDEIDVGNTSGGPSLHIEYKATNTDYSISSATVTSWSGDTTSAPSISHTTDRVTIDSTFSLLQFYYGTPATKEIKYSIRIVQGGTTTSINDLKCSVSYDGGKTLTFDAVIKAASGFSVLYTFFHVFGLEIHSTATTYGHPTMIDCDLGEAYADDNGVISSLNSYINLGSQLPVLVSGSNTITYDNTITSLKVTPRWWKV